MSLFYYFQVSRRTTPYVPDRQRPINDVGIYRYIFIILIKTYFFCEIAISLLLFFLRISFTSRGRVRGTYDRNAQTFSIKKYVGDIGRGNCVGNKNNKNVQYILLPKRECSERPVGLVTVGVGHGSAPKVVGGHVGQRSGAQHVGVHGHSRYVIVHEIATQAVPVARGDGHGYGRVHGDRNAGPIALLSAGSPATTVVLVLRLRLLLMVTMVVVAGAAIAVMVRRAPHRGYRTPVTIKRARTGR